MALEEALRAYLLGQSAITALVGERIYHGEAPEGAAKPLVVVRRVSTPRDYVQTGPSGLTWPRVQLTIRAARQQEALEVAAALRQALSGYKGPMGAVQVDAVFVVNEFDGFGFGSRTYERMMDVIIWHHE